MNGRGPAGRDGFRPVFARTVILTAFPNMHMIRVPSTREFCQGTGLHMIHRSQT